VLKRGQLGQRFWCVETWTVGGRAFSVLKRGQLGQSFWCVETWTVGAELLVC